jgi:hypothetical protein
LLKILSLNIYLKDAKLALESIEVAALEEKKKNDKIRDLNQLLAQIDKSSKNITQELNQTDSHKLPEIDNKNARFPTFR